MPVRHAGATWEGDLKGGKGIIRTATGAFETQYSHSSRFEDGSGTNPEELIAAAHAGCYSMALADGLSKAGHEPIEVRTDARVHIDEQNGGFAITRIQLITEAEVTGIDPSEFREIAEATKTDCPVSKALAAVPIELSSTLVS
jgi:osmotically inducible protein OsmC